MKSSILSKCPSPSSLRLGEMPVLPGGRLSSRTFGTSGTSKKLLEIDPSLDTNSRRMAVVNLEAALACWQSIQNHKVAKISHGYRSRICSQLRLTPSRIGGLPNDLMAHGFDTDYPVR